MAVTIVSDTVIGPGHGGQGHLRLLCGTVTLDGSNPTPVDLANYVSAIHGCSASIGGTAATGADPNQITAVINGTTLDVYAWKVTTGGAAGNPTEIASTENTRVINWMALGPKV